MNIKLDVIENVDAMTAMDELHQCIDLLVTDPPYRTITGGRANGNCGRPTGILKSNNGLFEHQTDIAPLDWMLKANNALKSGSHAYIFTNCLNMREMLNAAYLAGFQLHNILVWQKNNCTPSQYYMKNCEYVLFLRKGKAKYINDIGGSKTVHQFNNVRNKLHPCEKPIDLLKFYIANSSNVGDIVLDPFAGSGSTMKAALSLGRHFVGYEINKEWIEKGGCRIGS